MAHTLEKPDQKEFAIFQKKFQSLLNEYSYVVQPALKVSPLGIVPLINVYKKVEEQPAIQVPEEGESLINPDEKAIN